MSELRDAEEKLGPKMRLQALSLTGSLNELVRFAIETGTPTALVVGVLIGILIRLSRRHGFSIDHVANEMRRLDAVAQAEGLFDAQTPAAGRPL